MSEVARKITVDLGWQTGCDWSDISTIKLEFTEDELFNIQKHQSYLEENTDVFKVCMWFDSFELLDSDENEADFRHDGGELYIFKDKVYFFCQSKYDSASLFESQEITNELLF